MSIILEAAVKSNAWPFLEAKRIFDHIQGKVPKKGYVLFETGYGPSGLPHIGTFAEVARTSMVIAAFKQICDIPTKLFCFSDDMDGMRRVPTNLPNQDMLAKYLDHPLSDIPDPFGQCNSFGEYMNNKLCSFLDHFGFEYKLISSAQCYKSGMFDHMMSRVIENYDQIMGIMLPTLREERRGTYSPFMPICPQTGKVLQVAVEQVNFNSKTIIYKDENSNAIEVSVLKGNCKLQWKPDFAMRWAALDVDYEMYGKEHRPNSEIYSNICKVLDGNVPVQFFYELFLNEEGSKISKSKGNSITVDEWLTYAPLESMALFMYNSPAKAKRLHFDIIPKHVDDYLIFNQKYHQELDVTKKITNPVHHIHSGNVPQISMHGINFSLLLNLASICNPDDKSVLWGFVTKYAPSATPSSAKYLDHLIDFSIKYYNDFVKKNKTYLSPNDKHKEILSQISNMLDSLDNNITSEEIQSKLYSIGKESGYDNLRDFFQMLYQILLGQDQGPRLGSFIKLYGIKQMQKLIISKVFNT